MRRPIDLLSAGELLVDFVTAEFVQTKEEAFLFKRMPGGSPSNLAMNLARLGHKTLLAATVGNDDMGAFLRNYVEKTGVDTTHIAQVDDPTTLILSTRSATGYSFQAYRGADAQLSIRQFPFQRFEEINILHSTCFAMSRNPAQQVLLQAAEKAKRAGCQLSIHVNYNNKIWPEKSEAQRLVAEWCRLNALVKINASCWEMLYDSGATQPEAIIEHFLKMGATEVCFSNGSEGWWLGNGEEKHHLPTRSIEKKDTNSVGDAFWAGYLSARLEGRTMVECSLAGRKMAEIKSSYSGPLPDKIDRALAFEDLG